MMEYSFAVACLLLLTVTDFFKVTAYANETDSVVGTDIKGNLHLNTTESNASLFWNGVDLIQQLSLQTTQLSSQKAEISSLTAENYNLKQITRQLCRKFYVDSSNATFSSQNIITILAFGTRSVFSVDIDGDGDMDVLSANWNDAKVAWYENVDGLGTFGAQQVITTLADGAWSVFSVDIDGDGDMDVLSASQNDDKIAWYENIDGLGTFGVQQVITTLANGAVSVYSADIDGDGDMDVLSASLDDDKIAWYENVDGMGTFGEQQVITTLTDGARAVISADIDGDGDMDVLSASFYDGKIAWYENIDGLGTFGAQQVISALNIGPQSVFAVDVDGDGDMDVLSASYSDNKVAWYENVDGLGAFGPQQVITTLSDAPRSVFSADMDGDGDMDVLSASWNDHKVAWYENVDGRGTFGVQQVISNMTVYAISVVAADIDGDGDMDVLSGSAGDDKVAWYENVGC